MSEPRPSGPGAGSTDESGGATGGSTRRSTGQPGTKEKSGRDESTPYLLFRVDDRLLHGQVTVGWGLRIGPRRYLLADDVLANDPISRRLYVSAAPEGTVTEVVGVDELLGRDEPADRRAETVLLVRTVLTAARLLRGGLVGPVNLGGVHDHVDAAELLPYLHLNPDERRLLLALIGEGFEFEARDLPESEAVGGESLRSLLAIPE